MHGNYVLNKEKDSGQPGTKAMATTMAHVPDQRPKTREDFTIEPAEDLYCQEGSSMVGLPELAYRYGRNGFGICPGSTCGAVQ